MDVHGEEGGADRVCEFRRQLSETSVQCHIAPVAVGMKHGFAERASERCFESVEVQRWCTGAISLEENGVSVRNCCFNAGITHRWGPAFVGRGESATRLRGTGWCREQTQGILSKRQHWAVFSKSVGFPQTTHGQYSRCGLRTGRLLTGGRELAF